MLTAHMPRLCEEPEWVSFDQAVLLPRSTSSVRNTFPLGIVLPQEKAPYEATSLRDSEALRGLHFTFVRINASTDRSSSRGRASSEAGWAPTAEPYERFGYASSLQTYFKLSGECAML